MKWFLVLALFLISRSPALAVPMIQRFAFGSCNNQNDSQPLWNDLLAQKPELFVWGGDVIYADWTHDPIEESYRRQYDQPDYARIRQSVPILGVWDDHDYGSDNADGHFKEKQKSQKLFLDFLNEPEDSPRRRQEGIYASYEYGEEAHKIKFLMLDNRYFKGLDPRAPMLGETQWQWLEKELAHSGAKVHFIFAGLSVLSPKLPVSDEWADTPLEQKRLFDLLAKYRTPGVVFMTGDKHFASIFQRSGHLEFMSSGMTHVAPRKTWWFLRQKFPTPYFGLNYGQVDLTWHGDQPELTLAVRGTDGKDHLRSHYLWMGTKGWLRQSER